MNEIKIFGEMVAIKLKDGRLLRTNATIEQVANTLNDKSKDYIVIDGVGFNRLTEVSTFYKFNPSEMECFILSQKKELQDLLEEILRERKEKGLKTNGPKHLRQIYIDKYEKGV